MKPTEYFSDNYSIWPREAQPTENLSKLRLGPAFEKIVMLRGKLERKTKVAILGTVAIAGLFFHCVLPIIA